MTPTQLIEMWSIPEPNSGCWLWLGSASRDNRAFCRGYKNAAHLALRSVGVKVPQGWIACHRCDNPLCVNPDHIYVGTAETNRHDWHENVRRYGRPSQFLRANAIWNGEPGIWNSKPKKPRKPRKLNGAASPSA